MSRTEYAKSGVKQTINTAKDDVRTGNESANLSNEQIQALLSNPELVAQLLRMAQQTCDVHDAHGVLDTQDTYDVSDDCAQVTVPSPAVSAGGAIYLSENEIDAGMRGHMNILPGYGAEMIIGVAAEAYIATHKDAGAILPPIEEAASSICVYAMQEIELQNAIRPNGRKMKANVEFLTESAAAELAAAYGNIALFERYQGCKRYELGVYQEEGPDRGIWRMQADAVKDDDPPIRKVAKRIRHNVNDSWMHNFERHLRDIVPKVKDTISDDREAWKKYIPLKSGVFFRQEMKTYDWDDPKVRDKLYFTWKWRYDYDPNAASPNIDGWTLDGWFDSLFDGCEDKEDRVAALWEQAQSFVVPYAPWRKMTIIINTKGHNGKGTYRQLLCNLGVGAVGEIPFENFGKDFGLETLPEHPVIFNDDMDSEKFIDSIAGLKSVISHDDVSINRKFLKQISYRFTGIIMSCSNGYPRFKNSRDEALTARIRCFPFTSHFSEANCDTRIKNDYINREEVLKYFLKRILEMPIIGSYTQYPFLDDALEDYRNHSDTVTDFMNECIDNFVWPLLPYTFLCDCYTAWVKKARGADVRPVGRKTFNKAVDLWVERHRDRYYTAWADEQHKTRTKFTVGNLMDAPEYAIAEYNLEDWKSQQHKSSTNWDKMCCPDTKYAEYAIIRICPETDHLTGNAYSDRIGGAA